MSQVLGDYNSGLMGNYNIEAEDTRNQWLPNGASYITAPNSIPMTGLVTTVTLKDLLIDVLAGTSGGSALFGQRIPDASDISLSFLSDNLFSIYKGESAIILTSAQLAAEYSGSIIVGELSVEYNETLATWTVYRDSNVISSGPLTPAPAYVPAGSLVWIGGTPLNNNPADITANPTSKAKDHWRIGNVEVDVDGTKILDFIMPSGTATNIPDIVGNNDGTLREGTGDGSDWAIVPNTEKPVITLLGVTPVDHKINTPYVDAGATADDQKDGDITGSIVTVSDVNTGVSGVYSVTYNVANSDGINADEVVRTVSVSGVESISFTPVFGAALATLTESNVVTLTGSGGPFPISVSNGEYRINGGSYTAASGSVNIGDTIQQRVTSSASYSTPAISSVNVDGVIGTFTVFTTFNPSLTASGEARLSLRLGLGL